MLDLTDHVVEHPVLRLDSRFEKIRGLAGLLCKPRRQLIIPTQVEIDDGILPRIHPRLDLPLGRRKLKKSSRKVTGFGEEKETDLGDVGPGRDMDQVVFAIDIEGILARELIERLEDFFKVPRIAWRQVMTPHLGHGRDRGEILLNDSLQLPKTRLREEFDPIRLQVFELSQGDIRTPFLPSILVRWGIETGTEKAQDDSSFLHDLIF